MSTKIWVLFDNPATPNSKAISIPDNCVHVSDFIEEIKKKFPKTLSTFDAASISLHKTPDSERIPHRTTIPELLDQIDQTKDLIIKVAPAAVPATVSASGEVFESRNAKRPHFAKSIAVNMTVNEKKHIIIPFKKLSACVETLKILEENDRPLIILHGSYVTGKSSLLLYLYEQLSLKQPVSFIDASSFIYEEDGGDIEADKFWGSFGFLLFGDHDVSRSEEAVKRLRDQYKGKRTKYFLLVDEISQILFHRTPRKEFIDFLTMLSARGAVNDFFGGFVGAGTYHSSILLRTPEPSPCITPQSLPTESPDPAKLKDLLNSPFARSPFQGASYVAVLPLTLQQTLEFLGQAEQERGVKIADEVKTDLHFYAAGNLGLVAFSGHLLLMRFESQREIDIAMWEKLKVDILPRYLENYNRMVRRIVNTLGEASPQLFSYILELLLDDTPMVVSRDKAAVCNELLELGIVSEDQECRISIASPYLNMLLLHLVYPAKAFQMLPVPVDSNGQIDSSKLFWLALKYVNPDVISARYSSNREGPAEVCIQAELFAVFRTLGEGKFVTYLEVKKRPGVEMRLDLMLHSRLEGNFAGFELKVHKLRKKEIIKAAKKQAGLYREHHDVRDMFIVNFVARSAQMDDDMPQMVGNVKCIYVRWDAGFRNLGPE